MICTYDFYSFKCLCIFLMISKILIISKVVLGKETILKSFFVISIYLYTWLPRYGSGKESVCQCRRQGFDLWIRKIPGGGYGNPLQFSCREISMV